jgi:hypothetical protein
VSTLGALLRERREHGVPAPPRAASVHV